MLRTNGQTDERTNIRTNIRTDGQTDGRSGPTTRPAFAKATQVKMSCLYYAVLSVPFSLVTIYWERADILALLCVMVSCIYVTLCISYGVSGQVWYLIVSIPDICLLLSYKH